MEFNQPAFLAARVASLGDESWKPVVGYEGIYEVSSLGRVRSLDRVDSIGRPRSGKVLSSCRGGAYPSVCLCDGSKANRRVHTLVLEAFVGPRPQGHEACHNDGNPINNRLENLRWDTKSANQVDRLAHGTHNRGSRHSMSKLTEEEVCAVRSLIGKGLTQAEIGTLFGVSEATVSCIKSGHRWAWLSAA